MVEKMKLLHITGPKNDIDRVMEQYLSRYEIHFENAASGFGISGHVRPFAETNIYKDACTWKRKGLINGLLYYIKMRLPYGWSHFLTLIFDENL